MGAVLVYREEKLLKVHDLAMVGATAIGRHPLNDIHLPDPSRKISRFHMAIFQDTDGRCFVQDLGSSNGIFVNGKKQAYSPLNDGDTCAVGDYTLLLQVRKEKGRVEHPEVVLADEGTDDLKTTTVSFKDSDRVERDYSKLDPDLILLLYRLGLLANRAVELEESLQMIVEELAAALHPDKIFVALFSQDRGRLSCLAQYPLDKTTMQMSRTAIERIRQDKTALMLSRLSTGEGEAKKASPAKGPGRAGSALSMPLFWNGEVRGLLHIDLGPEKSVYTAKELAFLKIVARDLGLYMEKGLNYRQLQEVHNSLEQRFEAQKCIIGISEKTRSILKMVEKLAVTDATVLIEGETGTGKDLVAEVIHTNSRRRGKPFIQVNCAAIPDNLLESELFGVIANYPGLHNREALKGKFELAQGGTVFLNEIGEMPQRLQAKLLDALENKVIWPLGRNQPLTVDVRIVAATNRDLRQEIRNGNFREDLYERLKEFPLHLSPLRERREDIPLLAGYFLHCLRKEYGKKIARFSGQCIEFLSSREWPGNVRELKHAIQRAIIWTESSTITPDLFDTDDVPTSLKSLEEIANQHIVRVLAFTGGNREKAAKILGISKQTLYNKAKEYHLPGFEKD